MSYDALRHFADSYGLAAMVIAYLVLAFWAFRPGARDRNRAAAAMILAEDGEDTHPTDRLPGSNRHG